jgi:glycosyltransferase involved in cell wall biosynthesis
LKDAIESILNQHFQDMELIIWDDASADDSWKIIESYHDLRIRAFQNSQRLGPVFGVNKAIFEMAHGRYIAIHHSDAVWESSTLQKQVGYLESHPEMVRYLLIRRHRRAAPSGSPAMSTTSTNTARSFRYEWLRHCFWI